MGDYSVNLCDEKMFQKEIAKSDEGDVVTLKALGNRVSVHAEAGQIGYINKNSEGWILEIINDGRPIWADIEEIFEDDEYEDGAVGVTLSVLTARDAEEMYEPVDVQEIMDSRRDYNSSETDWGKSISVGLMLGLFIYILLVRM